jgi:hypothetical protein
MTYGLWVLYMFRILPNIDLIIERNRFVSYKKLDFS